MRQEPDNRIMYADEVADNIRREMAEAADAVTADTGRKIVPKYENVGRKVTEIIMVTHPIYLGVVKAVTYDSKTDRYVVKFGDSSVKATDAVAEFILKENNNPTRARSAVAYAKLEGGEAIGVIMVYLSREDR